ncbi:MAG TPA: phosphoglycerate kinase [Candidatus Peribacteria bacterium]|nr:phosphoglycerate kinase [Candidatus Peribacteria bacterium]
MATYNTLKDAKLKGKKVLLRAGFDLPMDNGKVADVTRVEAVLPTMKHILDAGAVLIIMAHQGRPKDGPDPEFSQAPIAPVLEKMLKTKVHFASDCIGKPAKDAVADAKPGEVVLLENLRYHKEEKKNDPAFAKELAALGDVYVNDAFTNCHRNHASMVGVAKLLPSYMGFSLEEEVKHLSPVLDAPAHPLVLVISGAKMETKVPVIKRFLDKGEHILLGGCIANTFIAARGFDVGESKYDEAGIEPAQEFMLESQKEGKAKIHVPRDVIVADDPEAKAVVDLPVDDVLGAMKIFDLGGVTMKRYCEHIATAKMIVWNGPLGMYENEKFAGASKALTDAIVTATANGATSILGGGDTVDFLTRHGYKTGSFTFVSMGGGAMLEFIAGKPFESLKVLEK